MNEDTDCKWMNPVTVAVSRQELVVYARLTNNNNPRPNYDSWSGIQNDDAVVFTQRLWALSLLINRNRHSPKHQRLLIMKRDSNLPSSHLQTTSPHLGSRRLLVWQPLPKSTTIQDLGDLSMKIQGSEKSPGGRDHLLI